MQVRLGDMKVEQVPLDALKPYDGNAKKHTNAQISSVENSIKEFGFKNPILAWHNEDGVPEIVAGHGRAIAAKNLGMENVPVIFVDDLSDAQRRALTLVDNQTTMMTGWDDSQLDYELDILSDDFDMSDFGFDLDQGEDDTYTGKTEGLIYEPADEKPEAFEMYDLSETQSLQRELNKLNIGVELKEMLEAAAYRFAVFDYSKIADYYANGTDQEKEAIELLEMVIVDHGGKIEKAATRFVDDSEREMSYARRPDIEQ